MMTQLNSGITCLVFATFALACTDPGSGAEGNSSNSDETSDGDGDGDPASGDGDGDSTSGDGDGDSTTGDGDGDGDGDSATGDGDGDSTTGDPDPVEACGFETEASSWPLPTPFAGDDLQQLLADSWACDQEGNQYRFQLLDLTGDGAPDFLVSDACDTNGVGTDSWDVYENTGAGFAAEPISWALPTPFAGDDLHQLLADSWACDQEGNQYRFQLLDLTGDGAPDFLVSDACDTGGVGTDSWDVYENTGAGFAAEPISWALPTPFAGDDLHQLLADSWACDQEGNQYRYQLLDLTSDGAPDFLVSDACDTDGVGTNSWDVYENTGSGFAAEPISWALPTPFAGDDLHQLLADSWACDQEGNQYRFQLVDLTSDGGPDFLVSDACDTDGVGTDTWNVYENTGAGFAAEPISWSLPTPFPGDDLHQLLADSWACDQEGNQYRYQLLDLTGDASPDFLVSDACDGVGVGTDTWNVYENTGSGFAAGPINWPLPVPFPGDDLHQLIGDSWACDQEGNQYRFQLLELTGDGAPDFLVSDACDLDGVGTDTWDVYAATETCP